jgi:hypothetical protein
MTMPSSVSWGPARAGPSRAEQPVYPKPPPPGPRVQIYAQNAVLSDRRRLSLNEIARGELAVLPDGRLRSRRHVRMNDGSIVLAYAAFDPEGDVERPLPSAVDWLARFEAIAASQGGLACFHELGPPAQTERERFAIEFPELAAELGVELPKAPVTLFNCGRCWYRKTLLPNVAIGLAPEAWRELALRHALGHWGKDGDISEVGELTEVMQWTAEEFPVAVQNAMAIAAGSGAVRSRQELPAWALAQLRERHEWTKQRAGIQILTVLGRSGGPQTLLTVGPIDD